MAAPPADAPSPGTQDAATAAGQFAAGAPAASLCGFKAPLATFPRLVPKIPSLSQLASFLPPVPAMPIAFNCNLDNPIAVPAKPWGGGRSSVLQHDPDADYDDLSPAGG